MAHSNQPSSSDNLRYRAVNNQTPASNETWEHPENELDENDTFINNVDIWSKYLARYDNWSRENPWTKYFAWLLIKYFIVAPILAPYYTARTMYYKAKYVFRAAVFLYPSFKRICGWAWRKVVEHWRGRQQLAAQQHTQPAHESSLYPKLDQ